jgi:predicted dehydrogenase
MKFLIAGLGSIGRRHLRNLLALGESDIILYRSGKSTLPDEELADFPVETSLEAALAQRPDAAIIANPTSLHLQVAIPAAEAGCHLLLEKPIAGSLEGVEALEHAVRQAGVHVLVGFQFRYHPGLETTAEFLRRGAIGRVLSARAHWGEYLPSWHPWEDYRQGYAARAELGGGVILTLCHPLDYLRWLCGEVEAVWAFAGELSDLQIDVEDTAEIGLRFQNGTLGSLHLDYNQRPSAHYLEIIGTHGTLRWNIEQGALEVYRCEAGDTGVSRAEEQGWKVIPVASDFERNHLFLAEMKNFLDVLRGVDQPRCSLEDGIQALKLALAARRSAQTGQLIRLDTLR